MPSSDYPLAGSCRCGRICIEVTAPPVITSACHCRGCQRMSASAYSLTATFPSASFRVTAGEVIRGGIKGPQLEHYFCSDCMTWVFTRVVGMSDFVNVRPTMLDDRRWTRPFIETMTAEKLPWAETPARHSYAGYPPVEDYGRLMAEFAAEG